MRLRDVSKILNYDTRKKAVDKKAKLTKEETNTDAEWKKEVQDPKKSKYLVYLTVGTFLFFVTAIATAYFVRYAGIDREILPHKVTIVTQGATIVDGGSAVPLTVRIANRNPVSIQSATLFVTYPIGTYKKEETITRLRRDKFILGEVKTGEIVNQHITPIFYGKSGEKRNIQYLLEYNTAGVTEPTEVTNNHEVLLRSSPVLLSSPKYTTPVAGKEVVFTIDVQSNSTETLPATYVDLTYPSGFTPNPSGFTPSPSNVEGTRWKFSGLEPGTEKTIKVKGTIRGEEGGSQAILSRVLIVPTGDIKEAIEIASEEEILTIGKAFLAVDLTLNGKSTDHIVISPGGTVKGNIYWRNQDSAKLSDLIITAAITGSGLDESSISAEDGGYFDEIRKQIVWDSRSSSSFSSLNIGKSGTVSFRFKALPDRIEFSRPQKYILTNVSAKARRAKTDKVESVKNIAVGQVRLRSVLQAAANTLYATSAIKNGGPLPPQVGKITAYALTYFIKNSGNNLSNIKIEIPLGQGAEITEITSGIALNEWEYDQETHTVIIHIPSLTAGGAQSSRSIELQVVVKPKPQNVGGHITLAKRTNYSAWDTFIEEKIRGSISPLTTHITAEKTDGTRVVEYQQKIEN